MQNSKQYRQRQLFIRLIIGAGMLIFILIVSVLLVGLLLGYRFEGNRLEQTGLVQFDTKPSAAKVEIDGKALSGRTATKASVGPGTHEFVLWREGYETWRKTLAIEPGTLTALTYPRLIPKERTQEKAATLDAITASRFSSEGQYAIVQTNLESPSFTLFDLREQAVRTETLTLPESTYITDATKNTKHTFILGNWDGGGRYFTVQHTAGDTKQWIIVDRENPEDAINASTLLKLDFEEPVFAGSSGSVLYAISGGAVRKLDIRSGTISRPLVSDVRSFKLYENNTVIYVRSQTSDGKTVSAVGYAREDDDGPIDFATFDNTVDPATIRVAASKYYSEQYISYTTGTTMTILTGAYPTKNNAASMKKYGSVTLSSPASQLLVSQGGDIVVVRSSDVFKSYDIERKTSSVEASLGTTTSAGKLTWLDGHLLWSDRNDRLTTVEFDGANRHEMGAVVAGQDASLARAGEYLYSFGRTSDGKVQLQRIKLVL